MSNLDTSYRSGIGTPSFEQLDTFVQSDLVAGAEPARQQPVRILLASSKTLARYSVVGLDANGKLVLATWTGDNMAITPIGVLEYAAASGASNTTVYGEVVLTGVYNVGDDNAGTGSPLVWDSSFDTIAKKVGAAGPANPNLRFRQRKVA